MCLGIPGRVTERYVLHGAQMGRVDFGGVIKEVCLEYVPEVVVGDYVIVHVGFAITRLDEESALETLEHIRAVGGLDEELATGEEIR